MALGEEGDDKAFQRGTPPSLALNGTGEERNSEGSRRGRWILSDLSMPLLLLFLHHSHMDLSSLPHYASSPPTPP